MRQIKTSLLLISAACSILSSCQGKKGTVASGRETASISEKSSSASPAGQASFSATIDGVAVSGNEIDELQLNNTAFIYPKADSKPETILFDLVSTKKGDDYYFIRFITPNKEGVYTKSHVDKSCSCSVILDYNLKSSDNFARYDEQSVTVNIQKITASGIQGTFSGTFSLSADTRSKPYKSQVFIIDGKFEIPFSTGNLRPM